MPDKRMVTILFIGDIVGKAGRRAVKAIVPDIIRQRQVTVVIANGENAAAGMGITPQIAEEFFNAGIHVITSGNHIWQQKEIIEYIRKEKRLLRPLNFPPETPGAGSCVVTLPEGKTIAVVNVIGRVFMEAYACPFRTIEQEIEQLRRQTNVIVVDLHAEATAEKQAVGWYFDGKVSAVLGTHTHVQTADERILPKGTAYITDVGMTGAMDAVIGVKKELALQKFLTYMPVRFECSTENPSLNAVLITCDAENGRAGQIERLQCVMPKDHLET